MHLSRTMLTTFLASSCVAKSHKPRSDCPLYTPQNSSTLSESSPNPIAAQYPNNTVTGTINGTLAVIPIPLSEARKLIPSQYKILTKAYASLLPNFPYGFYPLIIRSVIDHDIRFDGLNLIGDFQSIRIQYPFVDLLGNGHSSFTYDKYIFISSTATLAQQGAAAYNETVISTDFIPVNNAYAFTDNPISPGEIFLDAYATNGSACPIITTKFTPNFDGGLGPWPFEFYVNVTNQGIFSDGAKSCDQQMTFYNTSISTGENAPVGVMGDISVKTPYLGEDVEFRGVYGMKVDVAFIENNYLDCSTLAGL